jgi:hypothetical protein
LRNERPLTFSRIRFFNFRKVTIHQPDILNRRILEPAQIERILGLAGSQIAKFYIPRNRGEFPSLALVVEKIDGKPSHGDVWLAN